VPLSFFKQWAVNKRRTGRMLDGRTCAKCPWRRNHSPIFFDAQ
jgi:protein gp37